MSAKDTTNNMHTDQTNTPSQNNPATDGEVRPSQASNPNQEAVVFFRAVSWLRDSHGLFDYESRNIVKMSLKTQSQGQIIRNEDQIDFNKLDVVIDKNEKPEARSLTLLKKDAEGYFLDHAVGSESTEEESVDRLWLVARSLKNEQGKYDYKIEKFDAIKLGRVRFRVKDFRCDAHMMSQDELYQQELKEAKPVKTPRELLAANEIDQESIQCRICWSAD